MLDALADLDASGLQEGLAAEVEDQTRRRISEEKAAPDGAEWPDLSAKYAAKKAHVSSGGLLESGGDLLDSIHSELSGGAVEVGSNLVYAAPHQYGWDKKNIPQREYLGLSDENKRDLDSLVSDWLEEVMTA